MCACVEMGGCVCMFDMLPGLIIVVNRVPKCMRMSVCVCVCVSVCVCARACFNVSLSHVCIFV